MIPVQIHVRVQTAHADSISTRTVPECSAADDFRACSAAAGDQIF
ncbi:hypothetical protein ACE3NQ_02230 [Paenibacillus terreus]|uniref:Uncharacterized protein n=1 Tax=Paenibacillus terreus TaxID=1387834 RepID=A0ABV5B213_9BACL